MKGSSKIFIDGKEIQRLEGAAVERKAYAEAFKKLRARFREFKVVENTDSQDTFFTLITRCEYQLDITPAEKLSNAIAQIEIQLTTIVGRRVLLKEVRSKIEAALEQFHETRSNEDYFRFKALLDQYHSLLKNDYRDVRAILAMVKTPTALRIAMDFRYLQRVRSKLISRNVDEEDAFSIKKLPVTKRLIFSLKSIFHELQTYRGNHIVFGSLLS